ncbi:helix-turn-helix domain-containing protein [Kutzneria buriramensis]|uniref:Helix-turn-helix protein n=1 Tax=Kutzneria buriramensis TaxID=1045776 RepID=A0A3E0GWP6_9PSEU|nr:helix-turn-helix transcriptional regulator [Kutzneria buriramensis]REH32554.1 helix-turn-helix protein [Kutzneria buriramensis]
MSRTRGILRDAAPVTGETIGQRVRRLRTGLGLSQADLAGDELSASAISLLEAGRREPQSRTLELLARRLGATVEYLTDGADPAGEDKVRLDLLTAELELLAGHPEAALAGFDELAAQPLGPALAHRRRLGRALAVELLGDVAAAITELEALHADSTTRSSLDVDAALARCYRKVGRHGECLALAAAALDRAEGFGLRGVANHSELVISLVHELHEANRVDEAVALALRHVDHVTVAVTAVHADGYWRASRKAADAGHVAEALSLAERALAGHAAAADSRAAAVMCAVTATVVLHNRVDYARAAEAALHRAHAALDSVGTAADRAFCEVGLAGAAALRGDLPAAVARAQRALDLSAGQPPRLEQAWALMVRSRSRQHGGDAAGAMRDVFAANEVLMALTPSRRSAIALRALGDLSSGLGDTETALAAYRNALDAAAVDWPGRL